MSPSTDLVPAASYASLTPATIQMVSAAVGTGQLREYDLKRVKMATGGQTQWIVPTLEDPDGAAVKRIEGIILAHKFSRTYWEKSYEESGGGGEIPDCSSRDAKIAIPQRIESDDPDEDVEYFQPPAQLVSRTAEGAPVYSCEGCAFAAWGSKLRGGKATKGQACKLTHQIFLLAPQTRLPMVISLPPTSLKPAQGYLLGLLDYGLDHRQTITALTLEKVAGKGVPDYARAIFQKGETLTDDQFELAREYSDMLAPAFESVVAERDEVDGPEAA